ncbi:glycosyltransferase [Clostridium sp. AF15-17LB]|nr:glycosyltransferase [Clostridium sp. AF15-17LB]
MQSSNNTNNLLLFTKTYPFENGESFIENEIETASRHYDKIYIFSCQVADSSRRRTVPDNVSVFTIGSEKKETILLNSFRYLAGGIKNKELPAEWHECITFKQRLFTLYFYTKVRIMEAKCQNMIAKLVKSGHSYTFYSYWFFDTAYLAMRLKERFFAGVDTYFITRAHGYDLYKYRNTFQYFPFKKLVFSHIDKVFPCSENGAHYLKREYPEYEVKIEKSYLGTVDYGLPLKMPEDNVVTLVTCSNLIPLKRVERLAAVLAYLENRGMNLKWICFGDGECRKELETYCRNNIKQTEVVFKGLVANKEVMDYYKTEPVDLFVNLSSSEGLPVSIIEAMSFGIPSIATDVGGTSELVLEGRTGFLLPADFSDEEVQDAVVRYCGLSITEKNQLRESCRNYWETSFNNISNYEEFYNKIEINR